MSQEQLDKYFKDTVEFIFNKSKEYFKENDNELSEEEYQICISDNLKSFINKFYSYQSQILFSNINEVKIDYKKDKIKFDKTCFNTDNGFISNLNIGDEEERGLSSSPPGYFTSSSTSYSSNIYSNNTPFNINNYIQKHNIGTNSLIDNSRNREIDNDAHYYSSDPEFETQCCARISNEYFKIAVHSSEFLDTYPAGVFITVDGYVVGKPCHNMIPDEEFDEGNIFCDKHTIIKCEDIREKPKNLNTNT